MQNNHSPPILYICTRIFASTELRIGSYARRKTVSVPYEVINPPSRTFTEQHLELSFRASPREKVWGQG